MLNLCLPFARCEEKGCNRSVSAKKQRTILYPPTILTLHLRRFKSDAAGRHTAKITRKILFKAHLNLDAHLDEDVRAIYAGPVNYELCAVIIHVGSSLDRGHYFAYVRDGNGQWHRADDEHMYEVPEAKVYDSSSQEGAYMLVSNCCGDAGCRIGHFYYSGRMSHRLMRATPV